MNPYDDVMSVERMTVSMDVELAAAIRESADGCAENLSEWMAEAARRRLRTMGLRQVIADWEAEHGRITEEELDQARARLTG